MKLILATKFVDIPEGGTCTQRTRGKGGRRGRGRVGRCAIRSRKARKKRRLLAAAAAAAAAALGRTNSFVCGMNWYQVIARVVAVVLKLLWLFEALNLRSGAWAAWCQDARAASAWASFHACIELAVRFTLSTWARRMATHVKRAYVSSLRVSLDACVLILSVFYRVINPSPTHPPSLPPSFPPSLPPSLPPS